VDGPHRPAQVEPDDGRFKDEANFKRSTIRSSNRHREEVLDQAVLDSADNTKSGFMENGVVIGQTWDGPALSLKKQGKPVSYMAPQEGAIAWLDGWAITKASKNVAQAYEWINYVHTTETSAKVADESGYNPVAKGSDKLLSDAARKNFQEPIRRMRWRNCGRARRADLVRRAPDAICREAEGGLIGRRGIVDSRRGSRMTADVELDRVSVHFGDFVAVKDVSLRIRPGFFSFLGPSGCARRRSADHLGLHRSDRRGVRIGGADMRGIGPNRRPTALIFQSLALFR